MGGCSAMAPLLVWIDKTWDYYIAEYQRHRWRCNIIQFIALALIIAVIYKLAGVHTNIGWLIP